MAAVDELAPEIARLFHAKEERRRKLAALPWPDKVRAVVTLQRMAVPLLKNRDPRAQVWRIEEDDRD